MSNVCVYGLCKNMKHNIEEYLSNVSEADLIVILDLGSDDGSQEYIRCMMYYYNNLQYVEKEISPFDYAEARNTALYAAKKHIVESGGNLKDWIFVSLDLDERLSSNAFSDIKYIGDNYNCDIIYTDISVLPDNISLMHGNENRIHSSEMYWIRSVNEELKHPDKKKKDLIIFEHSGVEISCLYSLEDNRYFDNYRDLLHRSKERYPNDIITLILLGELDKKEDNYSNLLYYGIKINNILDIDTDNEYYNNTSMNVKAFLFMADFYHFIENYELEKSALVLADELFTFDDNINNRPRLLYIRLAEVSWLLNQYYDTISYYKTALDIHHYTENDISDDISLYTDDASLYSKLANAYFYASVNVDGADFYKEAYDAGSQACLLDPYNETYMENMIYYNEALNNANK